MKNKNDNVLIINAAILILAIGLIASLAYIQAQKNSREYEILSEDNARIEMMLDAVLMGRSDI